MRPCKACGRQIEFVSTNYGGHMPVDVGSDVSGLAPIGTYVTGNGEVYRVQEGEEVYFSKEDRARVPHWKTCSNPEAFRRSEK